MISKLHPLALCLVLGVFGGFFASEKLNGRPADPPSEAVLPRDWNSYSSLVKRVLPAVVGVEGQGKSASRAKVDDVDPGFGSGFVIDTTGVIVTYIHFVR